MQPPENENVLYQQPPINQPYSAQSKQKRLIVLIIVLLGILGLVGLLSLLGIGKKDTSYLERINQVYSYQKNLVELIDDVSSNATSTQTQNFLANAKLILSSDLKKFESLGVSAENSEFNFEETKQKLEEAREGNRFDEEAVRTVTEAIMALDEALSPIVDQADPNTKQVLEEIINNYRSLLE